MNRTPALGAILLAGLLVLAVVATGAVLDARTSNLELEVTQLPKSISPNGDGHNDVGTIEFYVRDSDPSASVEIVGRKRGVVRTLASGVPLFAYRRVRFEWNGRTDAGKVAPPGPYRLRVRLPGQDRDMVYPRKIELRS